MMNDEHGASYCEQNGPSRPLNFAKLTHFISDIDGVYEEFSTIPVNMPKYDELPAGVEDKNRLVVILMSCILCFYIDFMHSEFKY